MKVSLSFEKGSSKDLSIMVDALRASSTITVALDKFKEIFGYYPESVFAKKNDKCIDVIVNYGGFNVALNYAVKNYNYFVGVSTKDDFVIEKTAHAADSFEHEFIEFAELLEGKNQPRSYNDFIAPVFILNAICRSFENGREEKINRAPEI